MIEHKKPELRIFEIHYDRTIAFNGWDDYFQNRSGGKLSRNHHLYCVGCGEKHVYEHQFASKCMRTVSYWAWDEIPSRNIVKYRIQANPTGHDLRYSVVIRDEFGHVYDPKDVINKREDHRRDTIRHRFQYRNWEFWYNESSNSPRNRGLLPQHRVTGWYRYNLCTKYKHYPFHYVDSSWYRHPKTMNERRQYAAALIDVNEFNIRGRRRPASLPTAWDDMYAHRDRTWKRAKVRKQWMVNLQQG